MSKGVENKTGVILWLFYCTVIYLHLNYYQTIKISFLVRGRHQTRSRNFTVYHASFRIEGKNHTTVKKKKNGGKGITEIYPFILIFYKGLHMSLKIVWEVCFNNPKHPMKRKLTESFTFCLSYFLTKMVFSSMMN